jgi:hypothetical protein
VYACAKEFLVPIGSAVGSSDTALVARAAQRMFANGTSLSPIDAPQLRAELGDGFRYALGHPALVRDRLAALERVAAALAEAGVAVVRPVTAHAVFIPIDRALLPPNDVPAMISLLSHLFVVAGIRAQIASSKRGPAIRLALPLAASVDAAALARGVSAFFARLDERQPLRVIEGQVEVVYFRKHEPA